MLHVFLYKLWKRFKVVKDKIINPSPRDGVEYNETYCVFSLKLVNLAGSSIALNFFYLFFMNYLFLAPSWLQLNDEFFACKKSWQPEKLTNFILSTFPRNVLLSFRLANILLIDCNLIMEHLSMYVIIKNQREQTNEEIMYEVCNSEN